MNKSLVFIISLFWFGSSFAAGYEKAYFWGADVAGRIGSISSVEGASSLLNNPANLSAGSDSVNNYLSINYSPIFSTDEAPVVSSNNGVESDQTTTHAGGLLYSRRVGDVGIGVGYYALGGTGITFKDVDFSSLGYTITPDVSAVLQISEFSVGLGYKIDEQWKVGFGLRTIFVKADYDSTLIIPNAGGPGVNLLTTFEAKGLTDSQFGYRLGATYTPSETWGFGFRYRSRVDFEAEGNPTGEGQLNNGFPIPVTYSTTSIASSFPQQVALGGHYNVDPLATLYLELHWTEYSKNKKLDFDGTANINNAGNQAIEDVQLKWKDENAILVGTELRPFAMPIRIGAVYATPVADKKYAYFTTLGPGPGMTFTLGSGYAFDENNKLDFSYDYSTVAGDTDRTDVPSRTNTGSFKKVGQTIHLSYNVGF